MTASKYEFSSHGGDGHLPEPDGQAEPGVPGTHQAGDQNPAQHDQGQEPGQYDNTDRLYLAIVRLNRSLRQTITTGPGQGALSALATLVNCGQMRLGDLAARESVAAATMSRIVASLVEVGYVRRDPDPADRRAWLATATEEGARMVSGVRSTRMRELHRRVDRLSPEQYDALIAALPAMEALLDEDA